MTRETKKIQITVQRKILAAVEEVFDAWLDPTVPGNPWNMADKLILNAHAEGFFYWKVKDIPHYGRFTGFDRPNQLQHTWMSPGTHGEESIVTVTFEAQGQNTLMTLVHSDLPNTENGRDHRRGWNYFLDLFPNHFSSGPDPIGD
jgi:uncharacterized protein YndB with AHSA1/START domain